MNNNFVSIFLPFFMIFAQYETPFFGGFSSYGILILFLYSIYYLLTTNCTIFINKYLFILTFIILFISIFNMFRLDNYSLIVINQLIESIFILIVISIIISSLNLSIFYKWYSLVGSVMVLTIYYQSINLYIFGNPAVPITILPVSIEHYGFWNDFVGLRPSGFFSEPEAFSTYIIPLLILSLFIYKQYIFSLFIIGSIMLCSSTLGILLVIAIIFYIVFITRKVNYFYKISFLLFFIFSLYVFISTDLFSFSREKILAINFENNIRLNRGFIYLSHFNFWDVLFGINNNLKDYVTNNLDYKWINNYINSNKSHLLGYTTTMSGVFIRSGLISGLFFLYMLFKMYKNEDNQYRIIFFIILILTFTRTLLFNSWFIFYYAIYLGLCNKKVFNNNYLIFKK